MSCSVDRLALLKILLHSAKYPDSSINGLLLGRVSTSAESSGDANNQTEGQPVVHVEDTVPLFHSFLTTAPYLEIALLQVDAYCQEGGRLRVVGYYHANEHLNELDLKPYARKIADKVQQRLAQAVTLQIDNSKLAAFAQQSPSDILQLWVKDGRGWVQTSSSKVQYERSLSEQYMDLLLHGKQADLNDFDDHLNDITRDWTNKGLL